MPLFWIFAISCSLGAAFRSPTNTPQNKVAANNPFNKKPLFKTTEFLKSKKFFKTSTLVFADTVPLPLLELTHEAFSAIATQPIPSL